MPDTPIAGSHLAVGRRPVLASPRRTLRSGRGWHIGMGRADAPDRTDA